MQRVGGKNPVNLTADSSADDSMPAFSPDGKFIAFRSERNPSGIYVMEETGENARRVTDFGFHPSWSPDGKQIVVSDKASDVATSHTIPNSSLWIIDVETGNKKLLETKGDAIQPHWSPNGKRIAFWFVKEGEPGEIATIPADGGEPVAVTQRCGDGLESGLVARRQIYFFRQRPRRKYEHLARGGGRRNGQGFGRTGSRADTCDLCSPFRIFPRREKSRIYPLRNKIESAINRL